MKELTLTELEAVINKHANSIPAVIEDGVTLRRIKPYKHEADSAGCNWNVSVVGDAEYANELIELVGRLRTIYSAK
jgi:hypothetical protein